MKTRDYMVTFNLEKDSLENFKENILPRLSNCQYIIGGAEKGKDNEYLHCHMFFHFKNPIGFESLQKKFKIHHIEIRKGSIKDCVNYCVKQDTKVNQNELVIENTLQEELYLEKENVYAMLIDDILCGYSFVEIVKKYPKIAIYNYNNLLNIFNQFQTEVKKRDFIDITKELFGDKVEFEKNDKNYQ